MQENTKTHFIPAKHPKREKGVDIYARVSANDTAQLKSLSAQVSTFTRLTVSMSQWLLVDVYMDIASSKTGSSRREFSRMLEDCKTHITKNKSLCRQRKRVEYSVKAIN